MSGDALGALLLGVLLGIRHALDADHVVAVSTIVSSYRNPLRAAWVGISWGLGHTTTLVLVGATIILLRLAIPDRLALFFEFAVGMVLVGLGLQVLWGLWRKQLHGHQHEHPETVHTHLHSHEPSPDHDHPSAEDWRRGAWLRPAFRGKSYLVGSLHGLAGSAALVLLVLSTIKSPSLGVLYLFIFGLGSVLSMGVLTVMMGLPFSLSARAPALNRLVQMAAGVGSVGLGIFLMYEIGLVEGLFLAA